MARTRSGDGKPVVDRSKLPGLDVREALRSREFLKLAAASTLVIFVLMSTVIHFVPVMTERGVDRTTAAGLASAMGVAGVAGRLTTGSLLDRFAGTRIGGVMFAIPSLACAGLLLLDVSLPAAISIAILIGVCIGAEMEIASYLASRFFGARNFGTLFGIMVGLISLATGTGPLITSQVHDRMGSYDLALIVAIPLCLLASLLVFRLGRYPEFEQR